MKINEKYKKTFDMLNYCSNKAIVRKADHLKGVEIKQINTQVEFDTLIDNLNVVANESRFIKDRVKLSENQTVKGFVDQDSSQFFEMNIGGCSNPLRILVKVKKGKVLSFVSFRNTKPSKVSYDSMHQTELIEIHGKFPTFIENNCYLGVFAVEGSSIAVTYFFNLRRSTSKLTLGPLKLRNENSDKMSYLKDMERLRNDGEARRLFEDKIQDILEKKRNKFKKLDYVKMNKSNLQGVVNEKVLEQRRIENQNKTRIVKKKKSGC